MKIKNWERFQHYKDRNPPWIKLYHDLLDDREFFALSPPAARLLILLWLLASEDKSMQGILPNVEDIAFRLRMAEKTVQSIISELNHWVEIDASAALAERKRLATSETENRVRDQRPETEVIPRSVPKPTRGQLSDDEWITDLKRNPAYSHVNFDVELSKMDAWLSLPANRMRKKNRRFVLNWINRLDRPMDGKPVRSVMADFLARGEGQA